MRILLITSALDRGGAETHICSLAEGLTRLGHRVTVASAGGELAERLKRGGIRHVTVGWNTRDPIRLLGIRGKWLRFLRGQRFDLIHAHARLPAFLTAGEARRRRIPMVTTVHAHFRGGGLLRRLSRWGDRTVAVSEDLARYLRERYGVSEERITVIPNGIDCSVFHPERTKEDKLRVLAVSRLDEDCSRAAELLCATAEALTARFPQVELLIAGGGSALPRIRRWAEELHCRNPTVKLTLLGHVPRTETLYPRVQAVVGVSRCALEAMACGVPVILGGDEGFLGVAEGETLAVAETSNFCCRGEKRMTESDLLSALCDLLSRPREERERMGQALRAYVLDKHDAMGVARETEAVYRLAIEEKKRERGVLLCGYYGYGNTGDEALLHAALCRAREEYPALPLRALTRNGKKDESVYGISCIRRTSPIAVCRAIGSSSVLVFGGGTLLQDGTSIRSLAYYVFLLRYAQRRGVETRLWGNGIAAPRSALGGAMMRKALVGCDFLGLRDEPSVAAVQSLLGTNCALPIKKEPDLVLTHPPRAEGARGETVRRLGLAAGRFSVLAPKGTAGRGMRGIFCKHAALLRGKDEKTVVLSLFPKEDGVFCRRLCAELDGVLAENLTAWEVIDLMKDSKQVLGMRLHALIFAKLAERPFVGFGTDAKIEAFCREANGRYFTEL